MTSVGKGTRIRRLFQFLRGEQGSFTLESALIFPILFVLSLFLVFAGLFVFQQVSIFHLSAIASQQAAHYWTNSHADPETGRFPAGQYDDLYWRVTGDAIGQLLGLRAGKENGTLEIPHQLAEDDFTLPQAKLAHVSRRLPQEATGQMVFKHRGIFRKVESQLTLPFDSPDFPYFRLRHRTSATAGSTITEPVEFLRLLQVGSTYVKRIQERSVGAEETESAFESFVDMRSQSEFAYHDDWRDDRSAEQYLRELVNGRKHSIKTSISNRTIDALDPYGVAHQAFLTLNTTNMRDVQMPKDVELMETGKVNGVIWHFFRRHGQQGKVGPPDWLRAQLDDNGIVVVIHD